MPPQPPEDEEVVWLWLTREEADQLVNFVGPSEGGVDEVVGHDLWEKLRRAGGYAAVLCTYCDSEFAVKELAGAKCPTCKTDWNSLAPYVPEPWSSVAGKRRSGFASGADSAAQREGDEDDEEQDGGEGVGDAEDDEGLDDGDGDDASADDEADGGEGRDAATMGDEEEVLPAAARRSMDTYVACPSCRDPVDITVETHRAMKQAVNLMWQAFVEVGFDVEGPMWDFENALEQEEWERIHATGPQRAFLQEIAGLLEGRGNRLALDDAIEAKP